MKINMTSTRPRTKLDEIIEMACEITIQVYRKRNIEITYHRYFTSVISFISAFKDLRININKNYEICTRGEYCFIITKQIEGTTSHISMDIDYYKPAMLLCELIRNDKNITRSGKYIGHVFSNNISYKFYQMERQSIIESLKIINKIYCDKVRYHKLKSSIYVDNNVIATNILLMTVSTHHYLPYISSSFLLINQREIVW